MNDMLQVILDTSARIFTDRCTRELREDAEQGGWPDHLWQALGEVGLTRPLLAEAQGGAGLALADGLALVRLAGYHAVPLPLAETMLAGKLLADAGLEVPPGPLTLAPWTPGPMLQAERHERGWRLDGLCKRVPWGASAARVLAPVSAGDEQKLVCFEPAGLPVTPGANLAFEPRDTLRVDSLTVPAKAVIDPGAGLDLFCLGALMRAQQMVGAMQRILDLCTQYVGERVQFGRPLGKFQAIQQQLAVMAGQVAAASAAADAAVDNWPTDKSDFFVAVAKARVGEAASQVAAIGHQVHGAIGFTREHSLHYFSRRLWSWRDEFGSESDWQRRLGRQVLALGADQLWAYLVRPAPVSKGGWQ